MRKIVVGSWNYRLVKYKNPDHGYGLHEVYYNAGNSAWAMTDNGCFVGETPEDVIAALEMALKDAKERGVFEEPEKWAPMDDGEEVE